jgi:hypothetical protein
MTSFVHTRRLADYLEMAHMGPSEFKRAVDTRVPRSLAYLDPDTGKIENARELLHIEGLEATNLIPAEVYATVIEGSEPAKCMRNVLPIYRMPGPVMTIPYGETGSYASIVGEGAEVPVSTETLSVGTLTAVKYGERPLISREMVADAKFDVIANEIRKAGYKIENALNREALSVVLESSGTAADCNNAGTAAAWLAGTATAVGGLIGKGFTPTDIIWYPTGYGAILSAFTALSTGTGDQATATGLVPSLFGCRNHICGIADSSSTYTWGYGTNDYIGGLVIDRNAAGAIGMREDIAVEQYSDPVRDLVGMKVTARFDAISLVANATYRVQY